MGVDPRSAFRALNDIRDSAFLLSLGRAYLCEEPFMKKIGLTIESRLGQLRGDILTLKKQFPGKFTREVDTDAILDQLRNTAHRLQDPDQETHERCTIGDLGRELEDTVHSLTEAVRTVRVQVEGASPGYSRVDSARVLAERVVPGAELSSLLMKLILGTAGVLALLFCLLFFTLEREGSLLEEVAKSEALIGSQKKIIAELVLQKDEISRELSSSEGGGLSRQARIDYMDLKMKINDLDEKINELEAEIDVLENRMEDKQKKIETIRKKSFFRRLLRM